MSHPKRPRDPICSFADNLDVPFDGASKHPVGSVIFAGMRPDEFVDRAPSVQHVHRYAASFDSGCIQRLAGPEGFVPTVGIAE